MRTSLLALAALLATPLAANAQAKLVRYPHYHNGRVAFTYLADIWMADETGKNPVRLTVTRYLIADRPEHPHGNAFVVPVSRDGLHMEAHKPYATGLSQLSTLLSKIGLKLEYVS